MDNRQFYADHMKSNSDEQCQSEPEAMPSVQPQHQPINIQH